MHWAENADEVNRIVAEIAHQHGLHKVVKSKSMVSEECGLNDALENQGLDVLETDLGEYILQLAHGGSTDCHRFARKAWVCQDGR